MNYTYTFNDPEGAFLRYENEEGHTVFVPTADPEKREYAKFLASGAEAAPYVAPPEPEPLTAEQKLENAGLTIDELKTLLGI